MKKMLKTAIITFIAGICFVLAGLGLFHNLDRQRGGEGLFALAIINPPYVYGTLTYAPPPWPGEQNDDADQPNGHTEDVRHDTPDRVNGLNNENAHEHAPPPFPDDPQEPEDCPYTVTILLSAAGDATLGGDVRWAGYHAFMREYRGFNGDMTQFLRHVRHVFYASDLSIVNLEGTLTYATEHEDKEFAFRGPPRFAHILRYGYVDAVTISNNHTLDFFRVGYDDTRRALTDAGIVYFGNEFNTIMEVNGINVGLFGHRVWGDFIHVRNAITASVNDLRQRGAQIIIAYYHWGVMGQNMPEDYQRIIGRWTVDLGVDLVLGAHPHVIQGVENYNGVYIVYSLADFIFGGNANPADQDAFIFQQEFTFYRGELITRGEANLIPIFMSSVRTHNDMQPVIAEGADAERILGRLERYSGWLQ